MPSSIRPCRFEFLNALLSTDISNVKTEVRCRKVSMYFSLLFVFITWTTSMSYLTSGKGELKKNHFRSINLSFTHAILFNIAHITVNELGFKLPNTQVK